ncbi:MAG: hypoxanthine phosphoribosyltransferase, partial [Actinomycetota bacterium]|nr:hypoxanthine phosphoribosyltransferase [Actinomycetota bacterium]
MTDDVAMVAEPLITRGELRTRIPALANELKDTLAGDQPTVAISILKGSTLFLADLMRSLDLDLEIDFMSITSYAGSQGASGVVRIVKDLDIDISGRDVVIV